MTDKIYPQYGHIPLWMSKKLTILKRNGEIPRHFLMGKAYGVSALFHLFDFAHDLLDHHGAIGSVFFTEPYRSKQQLEPMADAVAKKLKCCWSFTPPQLRGLGNAIVPQVAAKFIAAFMETIGMCREALKPVESEVRDER